MSQQPQLRNNLPIVQRLFGSRAFPSSTVSNHCRAKSHFLGSFFLGLCYLAQGVTRSQVGVLLSGARILYTHIRSPCIPTPGVTPHHLRRCPLNSPHISFCTSHPKECPEIRKFNVPISYGLAAFVDTCNPDFSSIPRGNMEAAVTLSKRQVVVRQQLEVSELIRIIQRSATKVSTHAAARIMPPSADSLYRLYPLHHSHFTASFQYSVEKTIE